MPTKIQTSNQFISCMGALVIPVTLDYLSGNMDTEVDFTAAVQQNTIDFVSGVYINMAGVAADLSMKVNGTQQILVAKANTIGFYPLMCPQFPVIQASLTAPINAGLIVQFHNIPFAPYIYSVA